MGKKEQKHFYPDFPKIRFLNEHSALIPRGVTAPNPVTTTLRIFFSTFFSSKNYKNVGKLKFREKFKEDKRN